MYLRFDAVHVHQLNCLKAELREWCDKNRISYREKTIKRYHRVTFDQQHHYSLFALTWQGQAFDLVEPEKY